MPITSLRCLFSTCFSASLFSSPLLSVLYSHRSTPFVVPAISPKGTILFVVILLVGAGWSFLSPALSRRDRRILMVVIPIQVCSLNLRISLSPLSGIYPSAHGLFLWDISLSWQVLVNVALAVVEERVQTYSKLMMWVRRAASCAGFICFGSHHFPFPPTCPFLPRFMVSVVHLDSQRDILRIIDFACCVAVLVPVVMTIRSLNSEAQESGQSAYAVLLRFGPTSSSFVVFKVGIPNYYYRLQPPLQHCVLWRSSASSGPSTC